jgi:hypothetical protein
MNACTWASVGRLISKKKARTLIAIAPIVTNATPECSFSSPIGNMIGEA